MDFTAVASYIRSNPGVLPERMAEEFGMSVRSIRVYVGRTNVAMDGTATIELRRGKGYLLRISDEEGFDAWINGQSYPARAAMPQTPDERVNYLLNDLLMREGWVTIGDLANILVVSSSTISHDLKAVEGVLTIFGLALERRPHYGVRVTGTEMNRRRCLAYVIARDLAASDASEGLGGLAAASMGATDVPRIGNPSSDVTSLLGIISECVEQVAGEMGYQINPFAYQNLLVHVSVTIMRARAQRHVSMEFESAEHIRTLPGYEVACLVAERLSLIIGFDLPADEVAYLAIQLSGKQVISELAGSEQPSVISEDVWGIVIEMIELVWAVFRLDFRDDFELHMNLACHISPLLVRLRHHMQVSNPMLAEIKAQYALAFWIATDACAVLSERCRAVPSEDEIGYIALAFALAIERRRTSRVSKTILIVGASGTGTVRLLKHRCQQAFGSYVDRIETCDLRSLDGFDFSGIDYVFSTVPIPQRLPVPVCIVQHFLDSGEVDEVRELLLSSPSDVHTMERFFNQRLFFTHCAYSSKQEALNALIESVERVCEVDSNFAELVWRREEIVETSFGNNVAMPHPLGAASDDTFVAVALCDKPLLWDNNGRDVRAVFLCSFSRDGESETMRFIDSLASLVTSRKAMDVLLRYQTWEVLCALLRIFSDGSRKDAAAIERLELANGGGDVMKLPDGLLRSS